MAKEKQKKSYSVTRLYEVKGTIVERKNKTCPKCGQGYYLANHKNRLTCGKCGYMEAKK